ncbi:MAG: hypothetical protein IJ719_06090 [Clostridia bacterium]|nr:hypothetical protein [Clostridia bacterium]
MDENQRRGEVTIASGHACFDPTLDKSCRTIFERADEQMYHRKRRMKETGN